MSPLEQEPALEAIGQAVSLSGQAMTCDRRAESTTFAQRQLDGLELIQSAWAGLDAALQRQLVILVRHSIENSKTE